MNEKKQNLNTCVYCGSTSYGKGCPYAPKGIHIHTNDSKKCIYCGSTGTGMGCPFNPHDKNHVKGIDYNTMVKDAVNNSIMIGYIVEKLNQKIDKPLTLVDKFVKHLQKLLGNEKQFIKPLLIAENNKEDYKSKEEFIKMYELELELEKEIKTKLDELSQIIIDKSDKGLSISKVEKIILENFKLPR